MGESMQAVTVDIGNRRWTVSLWLFSSVNFSDVSGLSEGYNALWHFKVLFELFSCFKIKALIPPVRYYTYLICMSSSALHCEHLGTSMLLPSY